MATRLRAALAISMGILALPSFAAEVSGVKFADQIEAGGKQLVLNGAGLRRKFIFQVYAMALYLPARTRAAADAIGAPGPKRVSIGMLRDVSAKTFSQALREGIEDNHSESEARALEPRVKRLEALMDNVGEAKEGMRIALSWLPGKGTELAVNGAPAGDPIPGEDFYRALLRIWLGPHPVQDNLKQALLGAKD